MHLVSDTPRVLLGLSFLNFLIITLVPVLSCFWPLINWFRGVHVLIGIYSACNVPVQARAVVFNRGIIYAGVVAHMGLGRVILVVSLVLFLIPVIILFLATTGMLPSTAPTQVVTNTQAINITYAPAGIYYDYANPETTAIAGYYCIYQAQVASDGWIGNNGLYQPNPAAYSPPGYSVQLNAELSNGLEIQNTYGGAWEGNTPLIGEQVWGGTPSNWSVLSTINGPPGQPCGWLIIAISNGTAYFGYSSDGVNVDWYASYPVGNAEIIPNTATNLVIAGPGNSAGVEFNNLYAVLALYYWNGSAWVPANTLAAGFEPGTLEFVVHAWVYVNGNEAVVSWPMAVNASIAIPSVSPPGFSP